jgi:hypothetical protein
MASITCASQVRRAQKKPVAKCPGGTTPIVAWHEAPLEFGHFQSVAQSGLKSIARGLPWVSQNKRSALKGLECALDPAERFGADFRRT